MRQIIGLALAVMAMTMTIGSTSARAQISIPSDADTTCTVSNSTLSSWFTRGSILANAAVAPADSTAFPPIINTLCTFYQWAAHMFLWVTSPETGGGITFTGNSFFNVEFNDAKSTFQFVPNTSTGNMMRLRVRSQKPLLGSNTSPEPINGGADEADGNVLIAQKSPVWNATTCTSTQQNPPDAMPVYYGIHTNHGYAYYVTGRMNNNFAGELYNLFPSSAADMAQVESYALNTLHLPLVNPLTMTMVLKSAWIDATAVSNQGDYITISAEVPTYNTCTSQTSWAQNSQVETKTLALVGLHIVGTVAGHPEMIWATFEHVNNAPNFPYSYTNNQTTGSTTSSVPYASGGTWTFAPTNMTQPTSSGGSNYINSTAVLAETGTGATTKISIASPSSSPLGPANVARLNPWGTAPSDTNALTSNADVIAVNASVMAKLPSTDPRSNYVEVGAVWSQYGQIPGSGTDSVLKGGLSLANTTMETFAQNPDATYGQVTKNCFGCHNSAGSQSTNPPGLSISHIYGQLQPLQPQ